MCDASGTTLPSAASLDSSTGAPRAHGCPTALNGSTSIVSRYCDRKPIRGGPNSLTRRSDASAAGLCLGKVLKHPCYRRLLWREECDDATTRERHCHAREGERGEHRANMGTKAVAGRSVYLEYISQSENHPLVCRGCRTWTHSPVQSGIPLTG